MTDLPDKRYRDCMAEIVAVLNKYDMGGHVVVVDKGRTMFRFEWPQWTVLKPEEGGVRIHTKREDYPSHEAQRQACELTAHCVASMRDCLADSFEITHRLFKTLDEAWGIQHERGAFDPEIDFTPEKKN